MAVKGRERRSDVTYIDYEVEEITYLLGLGPAA
jgi:hypothetical protein